MSRMHCWKRDFGRFGVGDTECPAMVGRALMVIALLGLWGQPASGDPPVRTDALLIDEFIIACDGTLDSPDDLLCDGDCPEADPPLPLLAPDGHHLTWGEFNQVDGQALVKCTERGTHVVIQLSGLVPHGVYTIWVLTFEAPGFTFDFAHWIGGGSLGTPDGTQNVVVASPNGRAAISVFHPGGALSEFGEVTDCLLDEFEFVLWGLYHLDGMTFGPSPVPEPPEAAPLNPFCFVADQFAFVVAP